MAALAEIIPRRIGGRLDLLLPLANLRTKSSSSMLKSLASIPIFAVALIGQAVVSPALASPDPAGRLDGRQAALMAEAPVGSAGQATPISAAQQLKGLYLTGALGGNWPQSVHGRELTDFNGDQYTFTDNHFSGPSIEVGLGYDFGSIRAEVTYANDRSALKSYSDAYGSFDYSGGTVSKNSVLASVYWDIDTGSRFVPYLGGGIGYAALRVDPSVINSDASSFVGYTPSGFGYQAKVGLSYLISNRSDAFVEAVYRGMSGYNVSDGEIVYRYSNYNSWGFQVGARVRF